MKIITSTCVFPMDMDALDTLPRLARLGFDGVDLDFCYEHEYAESCFNREGLEWAKRIKEKADELGLSLRYSHAPFDASSRGDVVEKTMQCCQIMGIQYTVVHPIWRRADFSIIESVDEFLDVNVRQVQLAVQLAEKYKVKALSENLLWGASIPAKNIDLLVDAVNSPYFGWCFDTGHAHALGERSTSLIGLHNKPDMFHIQDNHGDHHDDHLRPFDGTLDWYEFMRVVKEIGYENDFTLEAHHQSLAAPDEERDGILTELLARSKKLVAYYDSL